MILFAISFVAGVLTVLAPCILPLLPVIVGGSISGGQPSRRKAITVVLALAVSVVLFTLLLKATTVLIMVPDYGWKYLSGLIVIGLGLVMIFPTWWEKVPGLNKINQFSQRNIATGYQRGNWWGDVLIGASLGPVFSTCSPTYFIVLATVLPERPLVGLVYLLAYAFGLAISLLLIALIGQRLVIKLGVAADPRGWFKKTIGIIFILVGLAIIGGYDKKIETKILDSGIFDITQVEHRLLDQVN